MHDFYHDCCQKNPFWKEPGSGKILCRKCFTSIIENRVRRTINRMKVIRYKSKIGIALSGGKDSTVLLHILSNLYRKRPDISLIALTIDEGIANYRDESLLLANKNCQILQVPNVIESFKSLYGMSLDEIINKRNKQKIQTSSCAICGVLRRRALNLLGKREKVDIISTGHTLDDQVQTIFLNLLRGDSQRILRDTRRLSKNQEIQRIKPLNEISEVESTLYAYVKGFSIQTIRCPYSSEAMRNKIRQFLIEMEHHHPTTMISTLRAYSKIKETLKTAKITEGYTNNTCTRCNILTSRKLCQTCKIIEDLKLNQS
ncbi:MAG: TIGR00269 family protein [Promethearchaeota archaeon]